MRRLLVALAILLAACAQDDPTIDSQPVGQPTEQPPVAGDEIVVTGVEYKFHGVPETLAEGDYTFALENAGEEKHELYLFFISGDQSLEELLELPEDEVNEFTQAVNRVMAPPEASAEFAAALVPGRFGYACFVESLEGTPHAFLGMAGEFAVQ